MNRRTRTSKPLLRAAALPLLAGLALACGTSGEPGVREASDRLAVGSGSAALILTRDGCLPATVEVSTSTGVTVRVPQGCVGFRDARSDDRYTLRVAPESIATARAGEPGVQAAYRITLEDSAGVPVRASFDPPVELELPLPPEDGTWTVQGYVAGREWSQEVEGADAVLLDRIGPTSPEQARMLVRQTGVTSVLFELPVSPRAPATLATGFTAGALALGVGTGPPQLFTQTLALSGPIELPLCSWQLINANTGYLHALAYDFGGVPLGGVMVDVKEGREFRVQTIDEGAGMSTLVLESVARNRFLARVLQCGETPDGTATSQELTEDFMAGGCAESLCPESLFVGTIKAAITIPINDPALWLLYFEEVEGSLSLPERAVLRSFTGSEDGLIGRFDILHSEASVPSLRGRLPEDWGGADDDRLMSLVPPPPIEVELSLSGEGDGMGNVESDLEPILSCDVPPLTCSATYLAIEEGEIGLRATANEESIFAGWEGCPDPLLDECLLEWDEDDTAVSFDVTARFEPEDDGACNSAYAGVSGYLPCDGAPTNQCKFYAQLDGIRSCDDACAQGGGVCVQAVRDVADGCSGSIPRPCDDPANDRICFCTLP